ncbi:hypothetical protein GQ44DRAFT_743117 [Phaeosphaeriaceae sp. PMI808]|nr:hypothetical protein GQ44DRAFT_743117 [Phaeosphaeriaceae sp. PMI808]
MSDSNQHHSPTCSIRVSPSMQSSKGHMESRTSAILTLPGPFSENPPVQQLAKFPVNVMALTPKDHATLLSGPTVRVIADNGVTVGKLIPKHALMASSSKLNEVTKLKPHVVQFRVFGKLDHESLKHLLHLFTTEEGLSTNDFKLTSNNFVKDVLIYQACLALGIYYSHTKPLLNALRAHITAETLTFDEMNTVINRVPSSDPLFKHLANTLKEIEDIKKIEKWLGRYRRKELQSAMMGIDQENKKRCEVHRACQTVTKEVSIF